MSDLPYTFRFNKCSKCGREFLVERLLIGTDHTIDIIVSCKECLRKAPLPEEFTKKFPEETEVIKKWLDSSAI